MAFDPILSTAIMAVYILLMLVVGIIAWKRQPSKNTEDYLLADRAIHWFIGFFSIAASQISALAFIGFIAFYYNFGIGAFVAITTFGLIFILGGKYMFLGPKVWKVGRMAGHITPSDTVRDYYDSPVLGYIVAVGMILAVIPYLQVQFTGIGIILKLGTGGMISVTTGAAIVAVVVAIYTLLGGMKSVAWIDTIQGVMLLGGTFLGGLVLLYTVGQGFGTGYENLFANKPGLLSIPGPAAIFDWVYILTFVLGSFFGWLLHPHMWIRLHYFKNGRALLHLPWVWSTIIWLTQIGGWAVVLAGALVIADVPPDQFVLRMYRQFFPTAVFALIASAALAAMMSSASSQCHGIGAVFSRDISEQMKPEWGEKKHLTVARLGTLAAILGAYILSTLGISFLVTSGVAAAAIAGSLIFPQVVAALYTWKWPTKEGAISASLIGGSVALLILAIPQVKSPLGFYGGIWGLIANIVAFVSISAVTNTHPDDSKIESWNEALEKGVSTLEREHRSEGEALVSDD